MAFEFFRKITISLSESLFDIISLSYRFAMKLFSFAAAGRFFKDILYGHKEVTSFFYTHDERRRMSWKGTKKMKKNYLCFGIIYCLAALLIFLAGISFYTKKKIDELNAGYRNILIYPDSIMRDFTTEDPEITACNLLSTARCC